MNRLPFDPAHAEGASTHEQTAKRLHHVAEADVLTVSQLGGLIKQTLERRIASPLRVVGEVSNLADRGHLYFSLKDEQSVVRCVAWSSSARRFGFVPKDGDAVVATGHVSHWTPQGRTQLYVSGLTAVGAGELERRFRLMCEELRGLGYFDEDRKVALPLLPRRIAVITSAESAALQDVISTAADRCPSVALLVCDVRVQGDDAAKQVGRAVEWVDANRRSLGVDAVLITRGGGSIEDLWAFNERVVADAVYACSLPVVAAIGHESDTTVVELVADRRAATPTQAVMHLIPSAVELRRQVDHHADRLRLLVRRVVDDRRQRFRSVLRHEAFRRPRLVLERQGERVTHLHRHLHGATRTRLSAHRLDLERLASRLAGLRPARLLDDRVRRLAVLEDRLDRSMRHLIRQRPRLDDLNRHLERATRISTTRWRQRVDQLHARLRSTDPRHVLRRGFSYTTRDDGSLVRSVEDAAAGDQLMTHLADGTLRSVVGGRPRGRSGSSDTSKPQLDLFDGS